MVILMKKTPEIKKGDHVYLSGLFIPGLAGKLGIFEEEVKKRGEPVKWRVRVDDPDATMILGGSDSVVASPINFITQFETQATSFDLDKLAHLNSHVISDIDCCKNYNTPFCPECGNKIQ